MRTGTRNLTWVGWCALGLAVLVLGAVAVLALQVPTEPSLGGKTLREHLRSIPPPAPRPGWAGADGMKQTLLQMAPDCFPYLLAMMRATDSRLRQKLDALLAKQKWITLPLSPRPSYQTRWEAARAIAVLGTDAQPAVPGLARLLRDPDTASQAAYALAFIDTDDARQALEGALRSKDTVIRQTVIAPLDALDAHAWRLVPALIDRLNDSSDWVRENAVRVLGSIRASPDRTVPALAAALRDRCSDVRRAAARALQNLGEDARPAEPALRAAFLANDPTDRSAVEKALFALGGTNVNESQKAEGQKAETFPNFEH